MSFKVWVVGLLASAVTLGHGVVAAQAGQAIKIGGMCDRTGTSRVIGIEMCPGTADYIALVNKKGGVLGHKLNYTEIDHAYMVPRAVDAYDRLKQDGVVTVMNYGVPTLYGLTSSILAGNTYKAFEMAPKVLAGIVNVNSPTVNDEIHAPMGGVRDSGWGRTGPRSLDDFSDVIWINSHSGQRQYPF